MYDFSTIHQTDPHFPYSKIFALPVTFSMDHSYTFPLLHSIHPSLSLFPPPFPFLFHSQSFTSLLFPYSIFHLHLSFFHPSLLVPCFKTTKKAPIDHRSSFPHATDHGRKSQCINLPRLLFPASSAFLQIFWQILFFYFWFLYQNQKLDIPPFPLVLGRNSPQRIDACNARTSGTKYVRTRNGGVRPSQLENPTPSTGARREVIIPPPAPRKTVDGNSKKMVFL